jgi:site-specific recombinase XerC
MTPIAPTLQAFFTDRLTRQLDASPRTIASYRDSLRLLLCFANDRTGIAPATLDWDDLDEPLITAFLQHLETDRHNSPRTRNLRLTAIRALFRYAALRHPEHAAVISRVLSIPARRFDRRIVTFLTAGESVALIDAAPEDRWEGRRDRAMLTLALHAGLRVSELIAVNCADPQLGTAAHVRVQGKGRKQRAVPLTKDAQAVLAVWLNERAGQPDDPLFVTRTGRRLTRDAVERRVATHAAAAAQSCPSLTGKRVHPHALRHSCAMSLLQARVDSTVIALWLGHADTSSTQQYIHADMTIKERALALLTPPTAKPGRRYRPTDQVLAYLDSLG